MSARKVKSAMVKRVMLNGYKGFLPVADKIARDLYSMNKAKDTSWMKFNNQDGNQAFSLFV